jgi:hypothetical protein
LLGECPAVRVVCIFSDFSCSPSLGLEGFLGPSSFLSCYLSLNLVRQPSLFSNVCPQQIPRDLWTWTKIELGLMSSGVVLGMLISSVLGGLSLVELLRGLSKMVRESEGWWG